MKRAIFLLAILCVLSISYAQRPEPMCNLGKSLGQLKIEGYNLAFQKKIPKGEVYIDTENSGDGMQFLFILHNGRVIEESLEITENDINGFATKFYNNLTDKMENEYKWALVKKNSSNVHFNFSYYEVNISLIRYLSQQMERMTLIYKINKEL